MTPIFPSTMRLRPRARGNATTAVIMAVILTAGSVTGAVVNAQLGESPGVVACWIALATGIPIALIIIVLVRHRGLARLAREEGDEVACIFTHGYLHDPSANREWRFDAGWVALVDSAVRVRSADGRVEVQVEADPSLTVERSHFLSSWVSMPTLTFQRADGWVMELEIVRTGISSISGPSNRYADAVAARISAALGV
jgi:hypothetical protein